jgi:hypothetical protein
MVKIKKLWLGPIVFIASAGLGLLLLSSSQAATFATQQEAEAGAMTGSLAARSNAAASGGAAVRFGSVATSAFVSTGSGPTKLQGFAVLGSDFVANPAGQLDAMQRSFPGVNALRIAIGTTPTNVVPSVGRQALVDAIKLALARVPTMQIVLDDHQSQGAQQTGVTQADLALYTQWGSDFKDMPQVSFNTPNEPGGNSLQITAAQRQTYDAIRAAGAHNRVWLEYGGYFPGDYQQMIAGDNMTNIGMDIHLYPRTDTSNATTDLANARISEIKDAQGIPLQTGVFEFGPSLTGPPSGDTAASVSYVGQVVDAAKAGQSVMTTAWIWTLGNATHQGLEDLVADQQGTLGDFGLLLRQDGFAQ